MNPFPGLRPFREDEATLFFGREKQVGTVLAKLARSHFVSVVGTSGSGKSSLVNCGLLPALDRGELPGAGKVWSKVQFRPANDPIGALARALAHEGVLPEREHPFPLAELIESTLRMSRRGLMDVWHQARFPPEASLLIVCDQFEELFRFRGVSTPAGGNCEITEDDRAFVNLLLEIRAHADLPIYVTITMRSDFLGETTQFPGLPEAIDSGQYLVPRMTRDERRAAVEGPIRLAGATISPVLLTRLVNDVGDNPDQLSILQHALNRTWAQWEKDGATGELDLSHYEKIGTMARALNAHAEKAYGQLANDRQREICAKMFKALTDKSTNLNGVRRPTTVETLLKLTGAAMPELEAVMAVFRKRSRSFLMPPENEPLTPKTVVDISHESLMRVWDRLRDWSDAEAQDATSYRRLVWTAELYLKGKANLWRGRDLVGARLLRKTATRDWAERYAPGYDRTMDFLDKSERRQRGIQSAVTGAIALVVLGGVGFMAQRVSESRRELQQKVNTQGAIIDLAQAAVEKPAAQGRPAQAVRADLNARFDALEAITVISQDESAPPEERSKITIEYSPKHGESAGLRVALEKLGFTIAPDASDAKSPRLPNCLWYDDQLPEELVKLIAYTVIGAGYDLVGIQPRAGLSGKSRVRINYSYHLQAEPPFTTATIGEAAALPVLRRKLAKAEENVIGSITEISEDGLHGVITLDDGRGPIRFDHQPGGRRLAVGDKVKLTVFVANTGAYAEWVTLLPPPPPTDTAPTATSTNEKGP
jgi:hypothetical protein